MARTAITPTALPMDTKTVQATGTAVDPTNGHSIAFDSGSRLLMIDIDSTFSGAKTFTLKAPTPTNGFPAGSALGDLAVSLNAQRAIIPVDAFRFMQTDGKIYVDVAASATGTIRAYYAPQS